MGAIEFELRIRQLLENADHHAIFSRGCCYHFALKLNEIYSHCIWYYPSEEIGVGHCWVRRSDGMAIDINGVCREKVIVELSGKLGDVEPKPIDRAGLLGQLQKRAISECLNSEIFDLAEKIIRTHERFADAKSKSSVCHELFGD